MSKTEGFRLPMYVAPVAKTTVAAIDTSRDSSFKFNTKTGKVKMTSNYTPKPPLKSGGNTAKTSKPIGLPTKKPRSSSENTKELQRLENRDKVRNFQKQATSLAKAGTLKNKRKKK